MVMSLSGVRNAQQIVWRFLYNIMAAGLVAGVLVLAGCASKEKNADIRMIDSPDVLYNQALASFNAGRISEASRKFALIDQEHPYTEWARKSLVMGIFVYYHQKKYDEAINMAKRYIALYPVSSDAAYAYYIMGLSYYHQIPDVTRDQEDARRAVVALREVVDRYPGSEYVADAKEKIRFAREQLAGKEMQVGRYYLERNQYLAAIKRFRLVVEEYSNTSQIEEALYRLVEVNYAMGLLSEAQLAAYVLGQNYPASHWYAEAFSLLQKEGLVPQKGKGGWLSSFSYFKKKNRDS